MSHLERTDYWEVGIPKGARHTHRGYVDSFRDDGSDTYVHRICDGKNNSYGIYCTKPGPLSALPSVDDVYFGALYLVVESGVGGVTMDPVQLICKYNRFGSRAWLFNGRQRLFSRGGTDGTPAFTVTAAAATGTIGTIGTMPANLLATTGTCLEVEAVFSRGVTATATFTGAVSVGGTPICVMAAITANADRAAWFSGKMWTATANTQTCT